jgi:hypothetical protein
MHRNIATDLIVSNVFVCYLFIYGFTSRKLAGSSPDEVDIFNLPNPSSLESTQPLRETSIRNLPGG